MSFSCILYPAVGSSCTQLLGSIVPCPLGRPLPIRWVQLYPFVGYKTDHEQAQGLLECWLDPVPDAAAVGEHVDATTAESQAVRDVIALRAST